MCADCGWRLLWKERRSQWKPFLLVADVAHRLADGPLDLSGTPGAQLPSSSMIPSPRISPARTTICVVHKVSQATRASGILGEEQIDDRVGNLVGDLVGMAFGNGFGREEIVAAHRADELSC
jgi:hypothetical protein